MYLLRGSYERNITPRFFWNTGASWDRNDDAGILNRYIVHAGVGNTWVDIERRRFATTYGISYTDREEEEPDPEKDRRFAGARLGWDYTEQFNAGTTFDNKFASNINLSDRSDYSIDTTSALTVSVVSHVSLKVSLQWLYENEPALESDLDVIAFVEVINPDGIPGSGDERFRTLSSGGSKLVLGSADARKDKLDTIVRTALVIKFSPRLRLASPWLRASLRGEGGYTSAASSLAGPINHSNAGKMHWSESDFQLVTINDAPGLLMRHPISGNGTYSFDIVDGRIRAIYVVRNPDKLRGFLEHTH